MTATPDPAALAAQIAGRAPGEAAREEAELYRLLAPRARLYGLKHLRSASAADDLAQDVMLHAIDCLRGGKIREPQHIASFVLGSCRMRVRDLRKSTARRERILTRAVEAEPPAGEGEPGAGAIERRRLARCLEQLPKRLQTLVALTFYVDRSSDEIARELGATAGNVRVMRHRALAQLSTCLGRAPEGQR